MKRILLFTFLFINISLAQHQSLPTWTKIGQSTARQTWQCLSDNSNSSLSKGAIFCPHNGGTDTVTGGIDYSTDHGVTWTFISPTGTGNYPSYRGLGQAPDGTIYTINQVANPGTGAVKCWYLNNTSNAPPYTGASWTNCTLPGAITAGDGLELQATISWDNSTIIVATGRNGITLKSTDNARTFTQGGTVPNCAEGIRAFTVGNADYITCAASIKPANCCNNTSTQLNVSTDHGTNWNSIAWPSSMTGCVTGAGGTCSLDASESIALQLGSTTTLKHYIGATGSATGAFLYDPSIPGYTGGGGNTLHIWTGNGGQSDPAWGMVNNRTSNATLLNFYEDDGWPVAMQFPDETSNWQRADTGITCVGSNPANCATKGGFLSRTASVLTDLGTGHFLLFMKNGEVWDAGNYDNPVSGIASPATVTLSGVGQTQQYTLASVVYQDGTTGGTTCPTPNVITWTSSNPLVASITSPGGLATTGATTGNTTITATCNNITFATAVLTNGSITRTLTSITIACSPASLNVGVTVQCTASCVWSSGTSPTNCFDLDTPVWASSTGATSVTTSQGSANAGGLVTALTTTGSPTNISLSNTSSSTNSNNVSVTVTKPSYFPAR